MGTKRALQEVDPQLLPLGLRVGSWRVTGRRGRGAYGAVYRVEWEGREEEGPFAMKLAVCPGDERFKREAWLLSRIHSPHVPKLYAQGLWEHPYGAFPYLVMQWIDGEPLYEWASRRNPTEGQALGVLAHVAHALVATRASGAWLQPRGALSAPGEGAPAPGLAARVVRQKHGLPAGRPQPPEGSRLRRACNSRYQARHAGLNSVFSATVKGRRPEPADVRRPR